MAKGLIAAGIEAGDRVALISRTRYEWTLLDYAIWFAGAVTVPVYETSSAEQIGWILADSGARAVVTETPSTLARVKEVARRARRAAATCGPSRTTPSDVLDPLGEDVADDELEQRRTTATPARPGDADLHLGNHRRPKGCMLTHGNFMFELAVAVDELDELFDPPRTSGRPPCCSSPSRTCSPASSRSPASRPDPAGPHRRHQEPARRPRGVPAHVHAGRAACLREGLQHRLA